jgi:hypothetical protein
MHQEININDDDKGVVNKEELPPYIYDPLINFAWASNTEVFWREDPSRSRRRKEQNLKRFSQRKRVHGE